MINVFLTNHLNGEIKIYTHILIHAEGVRDDHMKSICEKLLSRENWLCKWCYWYSTEFTTLKSGLPVVWKTIMKCWYDPEF